RELASEFKLPYDDIRSRSLTLKKQLLEIMPAVAISSNTAASPQETPKPPKEK
ncbi:MAG: hypothetical protein HY747_02915, partial [Elusimicrobia bacterium]|nr:hypothetical protein [Elusimicrobiota bacterium]